jgi:hypothetical protein
MYHLSSGSTAVDFCREIRRIYHLISDVYLNIHILLHEVRSR